VALLDLATRALADEQRLLGVQEWLKASAALMPLEDNTTVQESQAVEKEILKDSVDLSIDAEILAFTDEDCPRSGLRGAAEMDERAEELNKWLTILEKYPADKDVQTSWLQRSIVSEIPFARSWY
jgi:hypothetical protein